MALTSRDDCLYPRGGAGPRTTSCMTAGTSGQCGETSQLPTGEMGLWSSGSYRMLDLHFRLSSEEVSVGRQLDGLLQGFRTDASTPNLYSIVDGRVGAPYRFEVLYGDTHALYSPDTDHLVRVFLWHLTQKSIAGARNRLVIHAGVVARDGYAIVMPGAPNAGKSTLTASLVLAGFEYLSDEAAVVNLERIVVEPFPRALSLDPGSFPLLPELRPRTTDELSVLVKDQWFILPDRRGAPSPVGLVVVPHLVPGEPSRLEPMTRSDALETMVAHAFNLRKHGKAGFRALAAMVRSAGCHRLLLGDLTSATQALTIALRERGRL